MSFSIGIIGIGKLGSALTREFDKVGMLDFIVSKNTDLDFELSSKVKIFNNIAHIIKFPDVLFITVRDNQLSDVLDTLLEYQNGNLNNTFIIHCSGFLPKEELALLDDKAKSIARLHPYQTFFIYNNNIFENVAWTADCFENDKSKIIEIVSTINGKVFFIDEIENFHSDKYHISAVFASNYQTVNLKYAENIARLSGNDPAEFIPKIAITTTQNSISEIKSTSQNLPLTGPIARGDTQAVLRHIESLKDNELELKGYVLFGLASAELAYSEKRISIDIYYLFKRIFLSEINQLF
ncbi:MAG: DUF2520 domain-containing protein [Candidatus Kapabacteria bacterium]|nr:DUF2520 domain-containing protein [Ignavibacteriota bacterium]MCW5883524.1 DUF2520 domain-containing protein [Candidatus Kapabacteria bacterium]